MSSEQAQRLQSCLPEEQQQYIQPFDEERMCIDNAGTRSCIFLTNEGWCSVHRDHGESVLPSICQNFPRKYRRVEHRVEMNGLLSCPEVSRLIFTDSRAFDTVEIDHSYDIVKSHSDTLFWKMLPKLREIFQRIIQNSRERMPATLVHVLQFAKRIDPFCTENCTQRDVGHIARESKSHLKQSVAPLSMEHIDLSTCYSFLRTSLQVLVQYTPLPQHFTPLLKSILQSYQSNSSTSDIDIAALVHEYLRRKSFYSSHFSEEIRQCWQNLALYYIHDHVNDGSWQQVILRVIWLEAILSILWLGHPRLAETKEEICPKTLRETFVEVVYSFHRLQHFPESWKQIMKTIDDDQWLQQQPQQVCHLIVG